MPEVMISDEPIPYEQGHDYSQHSPMSQAPPSPTPSTEPLSSTALRYNNPQQGLGVSNNGMLGSEMSEPRRTSVATSAGDTTMVGDNDSNSSKHRPDEVNLEAGGVVRPTKQVIPDVKQPNFIKRMFGKKAKKDEEIKSDDKAADHYIPVCLCFHAFFQPGLIWTS